MVSRALQFATSDPKGPAYLMAAREVLEEVCIGSRQNTLELPLTKPTMQRVGKEDVDGDILSSIAPSALPEQGTVVLIRAISSHR